MTSRTDIDGEGRSDANQGSSLSGSGRRLDAVIPIRRAETSALFGPSAGGDPHSPPAPHSLGALTQAVVMRLANKRVRIRVAGPGAREKDRDQR
jgi:hypothetical protein